MPGRPHSTITESMQVSLHAYVDSKDQVQELEAWARLQLEPKGDERNNDAQRCD